eukprot:IDg23438t1
MALEPGRRGFRRLVAYGGGYNVQQLSVYERRERAARL